MKTHIPPGTPLDEIESMWRAARAIGIPAGSSCLLMCQLREILLRSPLWELVYYTPEPESCICAEIKNK